MAVAPETETTSKHVNSVRTRAQTLEEETETRFVSFPRILGLAWRLFQGGIIMPALEDANDFCTVAAKEMKTILNLGDSANVLVDEELDKSRWRPRVIFEHVNCKIGNKVFCRCLYI